MNFSARFGSRSSAPSMDDLPDDSVLSGLYAAADEGICLIRAYEQSKPELYLDTEEFNDALYDQYDSLAGELQVLWTKVEAALAVYEAQRLAYAEDSGTSARAVEEAFEVAVLMLKAVEAALQEALPAMQSMKAMDEECQIHASRPEGEREEYGNLLKYGNAVRRSFADLSWAQPLGMRENINSAKHTAAVELAALIQQHPELVEAAAKLSVEAAGAIVGGQVGYMMDGVSEVLDQTQLYSAAQHAIDIDLLSRYLSLKQQVEEVETREMFTGLQRAPLGGPLAG